MEKNNLMVFVVFVFGWFLVISGADEMGTLLRIKESIQDTENSLHSWDSDASSSPCYWRGIVCDREGFVSRIDLHGCSFRGEIPPGFCELKRLISLQLDINSFYGVFPVDLLNCTGLEILSVAHNSLGGALPDFSPLSGLKKLDLSYNAFSGRFPISVGNLTELVFLGLGNNRFSPGRIPEEIMKLTKLNWLYLTGCNFIGTIPASLSNLSELGNLELSENSLTGSIPKEIGRLKKLFQLELYRNNLSGQIPAELANMTALRDFDASRNMLSGKIPTEFGNLESLVFIQLYDNNLTGPIPEGFGNLKHLFGISMYQNSLSGPLPRKLGSMSNFNMIDVSQNKLSGPLPPDLCKGDNLQYILVLDNQFSGPVPESYQYCKGLIRFRVNKNCLTGKIPRGIWGLPHVSILDLSLNDFEGEIGVEIGNAMNLSELYLQGNRFSGFLPPEIGRANRLMTMDLSRNQLKGSIPSQIGGLRMLGNLRLQENMLSGSIPSELGTCQNLSLVNLAENQLTGPIPVSLGNIGVLNSLNLSYNRLSGEIPRSLGALKLSSIDFSFNAFEGPVPMELIGNFAGNPGLCGGTGLKYLKSCDARRKKYYEVRWIAGWIFGTVFMFLLIAYLVFRGRKLQKLRDSNKIESRRAFWDIKSFHKLSFDEHEVLDSMDDEHVIGHGGSGTVYRIQLSNGESVAVKKLWSCKNGGLGVHGELKERLRAEVETLGTIRHKNIVKLYCCFTNGESNMLVYEYMPNGNLWEALHDGCCGGVLDWPVRYRIALGVANGLSYLHHDCVPPIIHRDVKSTNILLDSDYQARVADFGFAKILQACSSSMTAIAGTHGYIAPEYAYSCKVTKKIDIYSFGVVLLELITGRRPVEAEFGDNKDIVHWISRKVVTREGAIEVLDSRIRERYKDEMIQALKIAVLCTSKIPNVRPTMREVVQMLLDANPCVFKLGKDDEKKIQAKEAALMADNIPALSTCKDLNSDCVKTQYKV